MCHESKECSLSKKYIIKSRSWQKSLYFRLSNNIDAMTRWLSHSRRAHFHRPRTNFLFSSAFSLLWYIDIHIRSHISPYVEHDANNESPYRLRPLFEFLLLTQFFFFLLLSCLIFNKQRHDVNQLSVSPKEKRIKFNRLLRFHRRLIVS